MGGGGVQKQLMAVGKMAGWQFLAGINLLDGPLAAEAVGRADQHEGAGAFATCQRVIRSWRRGDHPDWLTIKAAQAHWHAQQTCAAGRQQGSTSLVHITSGHASGFFGRVC